jgi:hypothetical protein
VVDDDLEVRTLIASVVRGLDMPWVSCALSQASFADQLGIKATERLRMLGHAESNMSSALFSRRSGNCAHKDGQVQAELTNGHVHARKATA